MKITLDDLADFVDERYLNRGAAYYKQGMVELIAVTKDKVTAHASGSSFYTITLTFKNGILGGECSCPAFENFGPCKHIAAVGYAVIDHSASKAYKPKQAYYDHKEQYQAIVNHLMKKSKATLVNMIVASLDDNPDLQYEIECEMERE
jgi:uncharacterized Zn finger protein